MCDMKRDQTARIAVAFARETAKSPTSRLCAACVEVLEVTGAGITVLSGARPGPVCVSDPNVAGLENLQFNLAQGPCQDAFRAGHPVHVSRWDESAALRWPLFVDLAHSSGIRAVSAYPLMNEVAGVGVLTLYRATEGVLTDVQLDDVLAVARVLTDTLISLQTDEESGLLVEERITYRAEIYQASGMVAVQSGVTPAEALLLIRAHGFAHGLSVADVATEIVSRRLRLEDDASDGRQ